jgi:metallo-beta-lactamase family protein
VKAHISRVSGLSAHADAGELLLWLGRRERDPEKVVLIHGEYDAQQAFAERLKEEFDWDCEIPELGETFTL